MAVTRQEAERVFNVVNGFLRFPIRFLPCLNDEDCTSYMICGKASYPGTFGTTHTPAAWQSADHFHVNLERVTPFDEGGDDELAFLICHEMAHSRIFPPENLGYWVTIHILKEIYYWSGRPGYENIFRTHMDFLVNEWTFRNKPLVAHLKAHGLDVYKGAMAAYKFSPRTSDDDMFRTDQQWGLIRYNDMAVMRETDKAAFEKIKPRPRYERINKFVTEFLASNYDAWTGDQWFEFIDRTMRETHMAGN